MEIIMMVSIVIILIIDAWRLWFTVSNSEKKSQIVLDVKMVEDIKKLCQSSINSAISLWHDFDVSDKENVVHYCKFCSALTQSGNPDNIRHAENCPYKLAKDLLGKVSEPNKEV